MGPALRHACSGVAGPLVALGCHQGTPPTSVRVVGGHERGGAGGVDAVAGALQAKGVGHPPALVGAAVACGVQKAGRGRQAAGKLSGRRPFRTQLAVVGPTRPPVLRGFHHRAAAGVRGGAVIGCSLRPPSHPSSRGRCASAAVQRAVRSCSPRTCSRRRCRWQAPGQRHCRRNLRSRRRAHRRRGGCC